LALTANCPSCGAPVVFKSAASIFAVCEYCQSTLVRHDQALEDIGKMAALVEDRSPLQLGSEGSYKGVHFALIGRIQLKYPQGLWNEWHLLFDDMRTGWLSEAGGQYVLTFLQHVPDALPAMDSLKIGQRFVLASQTWTVSNIDNAECVAGQGELPFRVGAGYPAPSVDLRNGANFATLDYSETVPLFFVGQAVDFKALKFANLREGMAAPERKVDARVFRCPSCGSPMQARSKEILAVGCASCGAVVDTADSSYKLLSKALGSRDEKYVPRLALGSKGKLEGQPVEVIGFLVRQTRIEGIDYDWREYLLAGEQGSYRWLTEYNGHWNIADVLNNPPNASAVIEVDDVRHEGLVYKHFSTTPIAEVIQVAGEFTWRVARGEKVRVVDYVAPPLLLSRETGKKDLSWSLSRYVEPTVIHDAFVLPGVLPDPIGVYANQPNPWAETHRKACSLFWKVLVLAVLLQVFFLFASSSKLLLRQEVNFLPQQADEVTTREFQLSGRSQRVRVRNTASLANNWVGLNLVLVNKATGAAWPTTRELSYYYGYEGGEHWTEGSQEDEVVFSNIPAGTYYLAIDPDMALDKPMPVRNVVEVFSAGAGWANFILLLIFLALFPVFTRLRHAAFEARRWAESDHAPVSSEGDDD
jgi:ribosomal protein L37AE/L43A